MAPSFKIKLKLKFDWLQNSWWFHSTSLFLDIFLFVAGTPGRKYMEPGLTQMAKQFWMTTERPRNAHHWLFMACNWEYRHFSFPFYVFGFPKHGYSTLSYFNNIWVFSKIYISTSYESRIFKNPCSIHTMQKKKLFLPPHSCLSFRIIDSKWRMKLTFLIRILIFPLPSDWCTVKKNLFNKKTF